MLTNMDVDVGDDSSSQHSMNESADRQQQQQFPSQPHLPAHWG